MARKRQSTSDLWHADDSVVENVEAPSVATSINRRKWARRTLGAAVFVALPTLVVLNLYLAQQINTTDTAETVSSLSVNNSKGKTAAMESVRNWLAETPSPLPGGRVVSWDGFETTHKPTTAVDQAAGNTETTYEVEVHYFTLASGSGDTLTTFASQVEVAVDPALGAKVIGDPTLLPELASSNAWPTIQTWQGYASTDVPSAVNDALTQWAKAFASGDANALRLVVGDTEADHSYAPLTGVASATPTVVAAAAVPGADPEAKPTQMLVRVNLALAWKGVALTPNTPLPQVTYDLLVTGTDTAAPRVVAWGGAGSGPSLKPYSNALIGVSTSGGGTTGTDSTLPAATATPTPSSTIPANPSGQE